jgi:hypothetical protein
VERRGGCLKCVWSVRNSAGGEDLQEHAQKGLDNKESTETNKVVVACIVRKVWCNQEAFQRVHCDQDTGVAGWVLKLLKRVVDINCVARISLTPIRSGAEVGCCPGYAKINSTIIFSFFFLFLFFQMLSPTPIPNEWPGQTNRTLRYCSPGYRLRSTVRYTRVRGKKNSVVFCQTLFVR